MVGASDVAARARSRWTRLLADSTRLQRELDGVLAELEAYTAELQGEVEASSDDAAVPGQSTGVGDESQY